MNKKLFACSLIGLGFNLTLSAMNSQGVAESTLQPPLQVQSIKSVLIQLYQELSIVRADVERLKAISPESLNEKDKALLATQEERAAQLQKEIIGRKAVINTMINTMKKAPNS